jgi:hypothetical protein
MGINNGGLSETDSLPSSPIILPSFQELDAINKLISDGKMKANEIRNNLKNLETTSTR